MTEFSWLWTVEEKNGAKDLFYITQTHNLLQQAKSAVDRGDDWEFYVGNFWKGKSSFDGAYLYGLWLRKRRSIFVNFTYKSLERGEFKNKGDGVVDGWI